MLLSLTEKHAGNGKDRSVIQKICTERMHDGTVVAFERVPDASETNGQSGVQML